MHTLEHSPPEANTSSQAMPNKLRKWLWLLLPLVLALAAAAALSIDVTVAMRLRAWHARFWAGSVAWLYPYVCDIDKFEIFGHGLGLALAIVCIYLLDPARRWAIPRVAACALACGGLANLLKLLVVRTRPVDLPRGFRGSVWQTFDLENWWPLASHPSAMQSFPSGHTALAAGLAAALIWLYPRGRTLFCAVAVLVGCQRVVSGAHFPSDVLAGAAAGCLVALLFLNLGLLPGWLDRLESRWRSSE